MRREYTYSSVITSPSGTVLGPFPIDAIAKLNANGFIEVDGATSESGGTFTKQTTYIPASAIGKIERTQTWTSAEDIPDPNCQSL